MTKESLSLLKEFEGCSLVAYKCPAGYFTIGYGNRYYSDGTEVRENDKIDFALAEQLLNNSVADFEKALNVALKDIPLPQNSKDAITILVFNIGITAFLKSTLYKEITKDKNNLEAIGKQWLRWCYADGKKLKGLENRRKKEFDLYKKGILSQYSKSEIYDKYIHKCNLK